MNTTEMHIPSNKVADIERYIAAELRQQYPEGEIRMMTRMLFEAFLGWDTTRLLLNRTSTVNQSDLLRFHWAVEDLKRWRPIQHIVGWTEFCGCHIDVDESTLIPRPETEEIVMHIIHSADATPPRRILDICTGSGCIAIALAKKWPDANVTGVDISAKALEKARENAQSNGTVITFLEADILADNALNALPQHHFDLIVSNPPYVMEDEKKAMRHNVLDWEPASALFVPDNDPLLFYRAIASAAQRLLNTAGSMWLEINENLGAETKALLEESGFITTLHQDFRGKDRLLSARL